MPFCGWMELIVPCLNAALILWVSFTQRNIASLKAFIVLFKSHWLPSFAFNLIKAFFSVYVTRRCHLCGSLESFILEMSSNLQHFGDNQSVGSSVPVVSRWLWPWNRTFLEVANMVVTWQIVAFLHSVCLLMWQQAQFTQGWAKHWSFYCPQRSLKSIFVKWMISSCDFIKLFCMHPSVFSSIGL